MSGFLSITKLLLKYGAQPNMKGPNEYTPLHAGMLVIYFKECTH